MQNWKLEFTVAFFVHFCAYHLTVCAKTYECVLECEVFFGMLCFTAFVAEIIKEVSRNWQVPLDVCLRLSQLGSFTLKDWLKYPTLESLTHQSYQISDESYKKW
jgi:hypothetical protein